MKIAELYTEFRAKGLPAMKSYMEASRSLAEAAASRMAALRVASEAYMVSLQKSAAVTAKRMATLNKVLKRSFLVIGAGMAYGVYQAVKFEQQLAMVSTMLDKTSMDHLPEYSQGLRRLSKEFGESTATLSKGLYDILSASIAPAKAMNVLETSAKSAVAGMTTTAVSADAITTILNSYGMAAEQAGIVSDKLFATVKKGKLTYSELAGSVGKVAATAAIAGLSLNEMLASIATITRAGISADQAMTAVVGTLRSFLKPTDEAKKLAAELGFTMDTTTLQAIGLTGVYEKLNGLSAEQLAVLFPNIRGLKGVAAAMQDLAGNARDLLAVENSLGSTEEAYGKMRNTAAFQLAQLKQGFLDLVRTIGTGLLPAVKGLTAALQSMGKNTPDWMQKTGGTAIVLTGIAVATKYVLGAFKSLFGVIATAGKLALGVLAKISAVALALPIAIGVALGVLISIIGELIASGGSLDAFRNILGISGELEKRVERDSKAFKELKSEIDSTAKSMDNLYGSKRIEAMIKMQELLRKRWVMAGGGPEREEIYYNRIRELERILELTKKQEKLQAEAKMKQEVADAVHKRIMESTFDTERRIAVLRIESLRLAGTEESRRAALRLEQDEDWRTWFEDFQKRRLAALSGLKDADFDRVNAVFQVEMDAFAKLQEAKKAGLEKEIADENKAREKAAASRADMEKKTLLRGKSSALGELISRASGLLPGEDRAAMDAEDFASRMTSALGPEFAGLINEVRQQIASGGGVRGGQWTGFADIYRQIQSAVMGGNIPMKQLKQLEKAVEVQKEIRDELKKKSPVVGP